MNPEQLVRQLPARPGYRVADFVDVGLPVYRITTRLFTQVQKKIGTIDEFLMRLVRIGVQRTPEISEFLGLDQCFVDDAFSQLLIDDLFTLHSGADRKQRLSLTDKGIRALDAAESMVPEEKTYVIEYDALLRKIVLLRKDQLLSGFQSRKIGCKQIRPLLKRPLDAGDLNIPDLQRAVQASLTQRDAKRFVLAVNEVYRKRLYFLPAVAVLYRSLDGVDIQVAFIVDGKSSPEHDEAFARLDGVRLLGIDSDLARDSDIAIILSDVLKEAEALRAEARSSMSPQAERSTALAEPREPGPYRHLSNEQNNDLEQTGVTVLSVHDHQGFLEYALRFSKHRVAMICPFLHESVVTEAFERQLEALLRKGVRVYIGYGMPDHGNRAPSKSHLSVIQSLEKVATRFRELKVRKMDSHAKLLLVDTAFFIVGSFNWLSFHGDPDRPFRDEQSALVAIPNMVERKFQELSDCFSG
jgi:PLD-like domain